MFKKEVFNKKFNDAKAIQSRPRLPFKKIFEVV